MARAVADLAGCTGTEQPYVMGSRSASIEGLIIPHDFEFNQITKRPSEDLHEEFSRLESARLQTIIKYGSSDEIQGTKNLLRQLKGNGTANKRKGTINGGGRERKKTKVNAVQNR